MRLTQEKKDAIIQAVIRDIPTVDYVGKMGVIVEAAAHKAMPDKVKAVYDDESLRHYLDKSYRTEYGCSFTVWLPREESQKLTLTKSEMAKLGRISKQMRAQNNNIYYARKSLRNALTAFNTSKQLREAMPELEKYIPTDEEKLRNLPVVTDVVDNLKKAGWKQPKPAGHDRRL